jgi:hypothetical protein
MSEDLNSKVDDLKNSFMSQAKRFFKDISVIFFEKYRNLNSFGWNQTGYYDGDGYKFTPNISASNILLNGKNIYDIEYESLNNDFINQLIDDIEKYKNDKEILVILKKKLKQAEEECCSKILTLEEAEKITLEIENFLKLFSKNDYEFMFGSKSLEITIYRNGNIEILEF